MYRIGDMARVGAISLAVVMLGGCAGADRTEARMGSDADVESATTSSTTSTEPITQSDAAATISVLDGYVAPEGWEVEGLYQQIPYIMVVDEQRRMALNFTSGPPGEPDQWCNHNHELLAVESDQEIRLGVVSLRPSDARISGCGSVGYRWRLELELDQALGDRVVTNEASEEEVEVVDVEALAQPTHVPEGWNLFAPVVHDPLAIEWPYGPVVDPGNGYHPFFWVQADQITETMNVATFSTRDAITSEPFELDDRAITKVTSLEDGAVTLAWEEGGWMYRVHGYNVDIGDLVAITESMS